MPPVSYVRLVRPPYRNAKPHIKYTGPDHNASADLNLACWDHNCAWAVFQIHFGASMGVEILQGVELNKILNRVPSILCMQNMIRAAPRGWNSSFWRKVTIVHSMALPLLIGGLHHETANLPSCVCNCIGGVSVISNICWKRPLSSLTFPFLANVQTCPENLPFYVTCGSWQILVSQGVLKHSLFPRNNMRVHTWLIPAAAIG